MYKVLVLLAIFAGVANCYVAIERKDVSVLGGIGIPEIPETPEFPDFPEFPGLPPIRNCGGVSTLIDFKISGWDGDEYFNPGQTYNCEFTFMPSKSAAGPVRYKQEYCFNDGSCKEIFNSELPNSSLQPGFTTTLKFGFVPNDILSGQAIEIKTLLVHSTNLLVEICVALEIKIR
ncbi:uncharacterized protein LOC110848974 [Folsomia candida]|uniref:CUB domain-containing protein n=1 Tax=Folsomia candida TaxID=158441 RepID=A0A226EF03_FOLCA|nr:uncharacterized protein LOC110848974 [Folsomia candida]OXA56122.1 hypothetical protein Fcan01_09016 [Folsomia candida]